MDFIGLKVDMEDADGEDMALKDSFKDISNIFIIGNGLSESAAHTFTNESIPVNVDPLSQECIVVLGAELDIQGLDYVSGANTTLTASWSTTTRTTTGTIASANIIAIKQVTARTDAVGGVGFENMSPDAPMAMGLDYLAIIATDNVHMNIEGSAAQVSTGSVQGRLYCVRAKVKNAGVYAALVQSELLS